MKKFSLLISLACATVFASCEKPEFSAAESDSVITFVAEKPAIDVDTKTAWVADQGKVLWSVGDKIRVACLRDGQYWQAKDGEGVVSDASNNAKIYASDAIEVECEKARFTFQSASIFNWTAEGSYQFYAISPATLLSGSNFASAPSIRTTLKSSQNLSGSTFDSDADIMVGISRDVFTEPIVTKQEVVVLFKRMVALSQLTFKNLNGAVSGEKVTKVTLTAQEGAAVTGGVTIDIKEGTITSDGAGNSVEVSDINGIALDSNNSFVAWFSTLEFTATSLSVDVETNLAHYKRAIDLSSNAKTFVSGKRNILAVNMATAIRTEKETKIEEWVLTPISDVKSDDVCVIVGTTSNGSYAMSNDNGTDSAPDAIAVEITGNKITSAIADNMCWNITKDGSNLTVYPKGVSDKWLYCTNTNNGVKVGTNTNKTFEIDETGYLKHIGTSRFIGIYNNSDWRCYTAASGNIANQTFAFYVLSDGSDDAGGSTDPDDPETPVYASLAELIAAGAPTTKGTTVTVTLTDEEIKSIYVTSKGYRNGVFLQVGDKEIEIFSYDVPEAWVAGGTLSGTLTECGWVLYNNAIWELTPDNWDELTYTAPSSTGGDEGGETGGDDRTVEFVPSDFEGQGTSGTGSSVSMTKDVITVSSDKGFGTTQLRSYSGSTLSISSSSGIIKSIDFTFSGSYNGGLNSSYTDINKTFWTSSLTSQARITKIIVTYE